MSWCDEIIIVDFNNVFQQRKKREKIRGYLSSNMRCLHLSTRGQCGPNSPNCRPREPFFTPPGFSWTVCRVYLASKQRTRLTRWSEISKRPQTICLFGLQLAVWRSGLSPGVNAPVLETSGLFVRRNITSTTAAWREQWNKGETRLRESWLDRSLLWVRTSVLIPMSEISKRAN